MDEVIMLKRLAAEAKVPIAVLAELCHCTGPCITNYTHDRSLPNGTKVIAIREGLKKYKELINDIILE